MLLPQGRSRFDGLGYFCNNTKNATHPLFSHSLLSSPLFCLPSLCSFLLLLLFGFDFFFLKQGLFLRSFISYVYVCVYSAHIMCVVVHGGQKRPSDPVIRLWASWRGSWNQLWSSARAESILYLWAGPSLQPLQGLSISPLLSWFTRVSFVRHLPLSNSYQYQSLKKNQYQDDRLINR